MGKNRHWIRAMAAILAGWMLVLLLAGCRDQNQDEEENMENSGNISQNQTISLGGEWNFYKDSGAKSGVLQNSGTLTAAQRDLSAGNVAEVKINTPQPGELYYSKLSIALTFGDDIMTESGAPANIYAQVNDGAWFRTEIEDFKHNLNSKEHVIDVGFYFADLVKGENLVRIKSDVTVGEIALSSTVTSPVKIYYYPVLMFSDQMQDIVVPGVWETQLGEDYTAYNGVGWYTTSFTLPSTGAARQYTLTFDGIDYYAEIWINDRFICSHEDGYSSVVIDFAEYVDFLQTFDNRLTVRVTDQDTTSDAQFPIKQTLAGFYHDSVGINYAGIWNDVYLTLRGKLRVEDITVETDIDIGTAKVALLLKDGAVADETVDAEIFIADEKGVVVAKETIPDIGGKYSVDTTLTVKNAALWEISDPKVYTVCVNLIQKGTVIDCCETTFGFTRVDTDGTQLLFNDRAIKLNGILSWLGNWDQLSPRFDEETFTAQIRALKEYGFNAIKFCLVVPPESLLDICDREGIYVYIEYPVWNPVQTDAFYERAYSQMGRFLNMSKNHPCVVMSDFNCEMQVFDDAMLTFMNWCVETGKHMDANRLFADNSSTGRQNYDGENDFWTWHPYTNALGFSDYAKSIVANRTAHGDKPVVFGEYADYPALADFDAILAANGGEEPWNWSAVDDPFRADLYFASLGYSDEQIAAIIAYSQQNCVDMKMYYVQETKKTDEVAAYFLTIIQDIGHSVAGFFDEMGNAKFTSEQTAFLRESVMLMETNIYNYTAGKNAMITPAISHYDGTEIENGILSYSVVDADGNEVCGGELERDIGLENGCYHTFSAATLEMPDVDIATAYRLILTLRAEDGYEISNDWEIYVYPEQVAADTVSGLNVMVSGSGAGALKNRYPTVTDWKDGATPDLLIAYDKLSAAQLTYLKNGGKVLYLGTGSEAVKVEQGTFYSQYVMVHFPQEEHEIVNALASKGYGGLQFLNMQTQYVITEDKDDPLSHSIIGKILLRDNVGDIGQSASYMSEFSIGAGTLIQSTLNFSTDKILGNYLIDAAINYLGH